MADASTRGALPDAAVQRDTTPFMIKLGRFLGSREMGWVMIGLGVVSAFIPGLALPLLAFCALIAFFVLTTPVKAPINLPMASELKRDLEAIDPVTKKPKPAAGLWYVGNDAATNEEVWISSDIARQHRLALATTGGGKTFSTTSELFNAIVQGSGLIYVDGKADLGLLLRIMSLAHRMGRLDDVMVVNYITGGHDQWGATKGQLTNTFNPLLQGSSSEIGELIKNLLDGEGDIWAKRADSFSSGYAKILVYLRDMKGLELAVQHLSEFLPIEKMGALVAREDIPMTVKQEMYGLIQNLPGMTPGDFEKLLRGEPIPNNATVNDQWGYITMQLIPLFNTWGGEYGHIFNVAGGGDVNMRDVMLNNRILIVLLPALEKAPETLAKLGRIVLSSVRSTMANALGDRVEGETKRVYKYKPVSAVAPFPINFDEIGYYCVEGTAAAFAQARGLNFMLAAQAQDLPAMKRLKNMEKEVESIVANANVKCFGRIEETGETLSLAEKRGGEEYVAENTNMDRESTQFGNVYTERGVNITRRNRLTLDKLVSLREGEVYLTYMNKLIKVNMPTMAPKDLSYVKLNQGVYVPKPRTAAVKQLSEHYQKIAGTFKALLQPGAEFPEPQVDAKDVGTLAEYIHTARANGAGGVESALAALQRYRTSVQDTIDMLFGPGASGNNSTPPNVPPNPFESDTEDDTETSGSQGGGVQPKKVLSPVADAQAPQTKPADKAKNLPALEVAEEAKAKTQAIMRDIFESGFLDQEGLTHDLERIGALQGRDAATARQEAEKVVDVIREAAEYPTDPVPQRDPQAVKDLLAELERSIGDRN